MGLDKDWCDCASRVGSGDMDSIHAGHNRMRALAREVGRHDQQSRLAGGGEEQRGESRAARQPSRKIKLVKGFPAGRGSLVDSALTLEIFLTIPCRRRRPDH